MKTFIFILLLFVSSLLHSQSTQVDVSANDLGINSLSVPANGSSFGNEIDSRGFSSFSVFHQCIGNGSPYNLRWRIFDAEGNLQTGNTLSTAVPGVGTTTVVSSNSDPVVFVANGFSSTSINPQFKIRGPFRKIQIGFQSVSQSLTCAATLIMQ